jgi:hypothetical protein
MDWTIANLGGIFQRLYAGSICHDFTDDTFIHNNQLADTELQHRARLEFPTVRYRLIFCLSLLLNREILDEIRTRICTYWPG